MRASFTDPSEICKLKKNKNAAHPDLKIFTEVLWLSRGGCLNKLYDLIDDVFQFIETENIDKSETQRLSGNRFILDVEFLADTTALLNEFNIELQGKEKKFNDLSNKLLIFKTKLFSLSLEIHAKVFQTFLKLEFF